jgi:predicted RNA binding protein YcfA (HicA-like mRNA interferase family)
MSDGRLPSATAARVIRALGKAGFEVARVVGSHHILAHRDDPTRILVVPRHSGKDLKPGTLRAVIRQAGLSVKEFNDLL